MEKKEDCKVYKMKIYCLIYYQRTFCCKLSIGSAFKLATVVIHPMRTNHCSLKKILSFMNERHGGTLPSSDIFKPCISLKCCFMHCFNRFLDYPTVCVRARRGQVRDHYLTRAVISRDLWYTRHCLFIFRFFFINSTI